LKLFLDIADCLKAFAIFVSTSKSSSVLCLAKDALLGSKGGRLGRSEY